MTEDIFSLDKALGMYPKEVQIRLEKHLLTGGQVKWFSGSGWDLFRFRLGWHLDKTYRAVKMPEVVVVEMIGGQDHTSSWSFDEGQLNPADYKITFNLVDGVPNCNSIKMTKIGD